LIDSFFEHSLQSFGLNDFAANFDLDSTPIDNLPSPTYTVLSHELPEHVALASVENRNTPGHQSISPQPEQIRITNRSSPEELARTDPVDSGTPSNDRSTGRDRYRCTHKDCKEHPAFSRQCDLK
jgi:hypothetical protein